MADADGVGVSRGDQGRVWSGAELGCVGVVWLTRELDSSKRNHTGNCRGTGGARERTTDAGGNIDAHNG